MDTDGEIDPAVESILEAARRRETPSGRVEVDARSLPAALADAEREGRAPVIAEVKPTSPTAEGVRDDDPVDLAEAMVEGGAAALSVLTEPEHFGGSTEALERIRGRVDVPVLRKDFLLEEAHLDAVEADVALLIARFLDDLEGMVAAARDRGFQALVEVHTVDELERAIDAGAEVIGVNNRDLARLEVDLGTFERVVGEADVPEGTTLIAESGISSPAEVRRMREAGADGLLIGSAIVDHGSDAGPADVRENTSRLVAAESEDPDDRAAPESGDRDARTAAGGERR